MAEALLQLEKVSLRRDGRAILEEVSLSLGVATVLASARLTPQELLRCADEQLYLAKAGGRARVCARFYEEDAAEISAR